MRRWLILAALVLASPAAAQSSIDGVWRDDGGYVEITVAPCSSSAGNARCGRITRIVRMKPGETNRDRHNDDAALRSRPILGVTILSGLTWRDGAWRGRVYNPEDGGTYRAEVRPGAGGTLEIKGCLSIICRTRRWPAAR
ncbi:MAG: DUF2147 domain-containing protein [Pseudomonadota bacterium]